MAATRKRVRYATIYVFPTGDKKSPGVRVSAAPETLTARPGDTIDWTVVNAAAELPGKVTLKWKERSPLKAEPKEFDRAARATVRGGTKEGRYRYSILVNGVEVFDPELEIMS